MSQGKRILTVRKAFLIIYDLFFSVVLLFVAALLSENFMWEYTTFNVASSIWPFVLILAVINYTALGLYSQMWLYASYVQYMRVVVAVIIQTLFVFIFPLFVLAETPNWDSILLYGFLLAAAMLGLRMTYRVYTNYRFTSKLKNAEEGQAKQRVLIVGAGKAGSRLADDLIANDTSRLPIAFVDDNPRTHAYKHSSIPVLGETKEIPLICDRNHIDEIIIAIPSLSPELTQNLVSICKSTKRRVRILPSIISMLNEAEVSIKHVQDVDINDLLGRPPIMIKSDEISSLIRGKVVLVTGGGGTIGSEIIRQLSKYGPRRLILFDIYENNVYDLQQELWSKYGKDIPIEVLIGSVRDKKRLAEIFERYSPQIIYHAAAHKHVPLMEDSPIEAIKNNVYGTWNVLHTAAEHGAERFILISTDKAVHPSSVMGASKRLAEMITLAISKQYPNFKCSMVRFGNVLGSNGSVVPLFKKQIIDERRVTVTHPDIVRFFMTIPEAVRLVLQASVYAQGGDIFVLDMGTPVKILDLAKAMIKLYGFVPDRDVRIDFVGLRPGEKLYEELYLDKEDMTSTKHPKILRLEQIHDRNLLSKEIDSLFAMFGTHYDDVKTFILDSLAGKTSE